MENLKTLKAEHSETIYKHFFPAWTGNGKNIKCFSHEDNNPSLSIFQRAGEYRHHCHACGVSGDCLSIIGQLENIPDAGHQIGRLKEIAGKIRKPERIHIYNDENGQPLYRKLIFKSGEKKSASFERCENGAWIKGLSGRPQTLYNLPKLKADTNSLVFLSESEKDADNLTGHNLLAVSSGGAESWRFEYAELLKGREVVILPHNDTAGRKYAETAARSLSGIAASIKVVDPVVFGSTKGADVSDFLQAGGTKEKLLEIIKDAPEFIPSKQNDPCKMPLTKLSDLFKEPPENINWLLQGILPTGGFSVLASKPKTGKSTITRNLALSVATGMDFLGLPVKQGPVIYLSLEEKRSEVKKHFQDMGATGEEPIFIFSGSVPADAIEQIKKATEELNPALIIIDPLFRLAKVRDGNDYVQVTAALEPLLMLARDSGAHVLCVHHTGKGDRQGGDSILGSTAIFSTVDTLLIMKRLEHYRTLLTIQRYGSDLEETTLNFNKETRVISLGQSKEAEEINIHKKAVYEFLASQSEPLPEAEIKVEGRTGIIRKALRQLVEENLVKREGKGGKGDPFKYSCFVVPNYIWEQGNKNPENGKEWLNHANYSCSRTLEENQKTEKAREQAFLPETDVFDRCQGCMLTAGQARLCEIAKPCPKVNLS